MKKRGYVFTMLAPVWILMAGVAHAQITVTKARIGCLDIQSDGNLTAIVANACNNKTSCSFKAPTEDQYKRMGVHAATRTFCTQAMEITYHCANGQTKGVTVPGDAWNHPPAQLDCPASPLLPPRAGNVREPIAVVTARIGCLDIQKDGNLTGLVASACNNKGACSYKAPTEDQYKRMGVHAATRTFCTQAMEITYRCGQNDPQTITVAGDAWNHPPAELACDGKTIATNHQYVTPPSGASCPMPKLAAPDYVMAPSNMLDWTATHSRGDYTFLGFRPPDSATPAMYKSAPGTLVGAPGSTLGANEAACARSCAPPRLPPRRIL